MITILNHRRRTTTLFAWCVLNGAVACGGGADPALTTDDVAMCKAQVMDFFARASKCFVIDQGKLDAAHVECDPTGLGLGVDRTRKLDVSNDEGSYVDFRFRVWKQLAGGSQPEGM